MWRNFAWFIAEWKIGPVDTLKQLQKQAFLGKLKELRAAIILNTDNTKVMLFIVQLK